MLGIDIADFIKEHITLRKHSYFINDIEANTDRLNSSINGKRVLVIGGAGTIGSSFIKALLPFLPQSLTVVDYSENGLTELTRDLRSNKDIRVPDEYVTYPFDFGGKVFYKLLDSNDYDIVACFAAHKHVRSEKDHFAIEAMYRNNVTNTHRLLEKVKEKGVEHFFSVSTDKAANPVNVMGASKKIMEQVLMAYSNDVKITTARFANVAFSNGSLLDGFIQRLFKRQPLSAPNDVRRYFVSPEESGQLCLLACILGQSGDIFYPKLKESDMKTFSSIAEDFLKVLGFEIEYCDSETEAKSVAKKMNNTSKSYPVYFFKTDTSGEKSYEEFYSKEDTLDTSSFEALGIVKNSAKNHTLTSVLEMLQEFELLFSSNSISKKVIVQKIQAYLSDFRHIETGKSLDQKM